MAEITKSEFINKMIDELNQMDEMKECKYSVNDVAEALFREATKDSNSGTITREKFDSIGEVKITLIVGFFISDKDKSGFVDKAELKFYLNDVLGMGDVSDEDLKELLNSIDTDAEVKLSLDEFTKVIFKK